MSRRYPDSDPFRSAIINNDSVDVRAQMVGAVEFMQRWKRWHPVIAGGALWSWAAGVPARDIDIFAKANWWSKKRAQAMYGSSTVDFYTINPRVRIYRASITGRGLDVFHSKIEAYPHTPIDFVLVNGFDPDRPPGLDMFDYGHCQVAFGLNMHMTDGAAFYRDGLLRDLGKMWERDSKSVMAKVQKSLWGQPEAYDRLMDVMHELSKIAGKPLNGTFFDII